MMNLLIHQCRVIRISNGPTRNGRSTGVIYTEIEDGTPCRLDFYVDNRNKQETQSEEFLGRLQGTLYIMPPTNLRVRDIIVIDDEQYDVTLRKPIYDSTGLRHYECFVNERDNPIDLATVV